MAEISKRVGYICADCGSSNVISEARAKWNALEQNWVVVGHYDSAECVDCRQEQRLIEVELAPARN